MNDHRKNHSGIRKLSPNTVSLKEYNHALYKKPTDNVCYKNHVTVNKNALLAFPKNLDLIKMHSNCEKMSGNYS